MTPDTLTERPRLTLHANRAADLMSPAPVTIRADANVREALVLLTEHDFSAVPVTDAEGRPVGVVSRSDLLIHDREQPTRPEAPPAYYSRGELTDAEEAHLPAGFHVEQVDPTTVGEIMTPLVFSVTPDTPAEEVIAEMLALRVHRLFVVDRVGGLVGVVSTSDILRRLQT